MRRPEIRVLGGVHPDCRKFRHPTRQSATVHMRRLQQGPPSRSGKLQVYRCPTCEYWHVGHRLPASELSDLRAAVREGRYPSASGAGGAEEGRFAARKTGA